jgi:LysR family glycine cleavage system transcriptional activator
MSRRLPSLNAIRAFEAAARHLSFTRAAEELFVTQAAVSHQVKALETELGQPLFRRYNRRLALTEAGQIYLPPLRDALDTMAEATQRLRRTDSSGSLRVSVLASFAAKWLLPRLMDFRRKHPEIDVLVQATDKAVDFSRSQIDVAIRYGFGNYPGHDVAYLMGDDVFPACSPALQEGDPPLKRADDLARHTLLHDTTALMDTSLTWPIWLKEAGVEGVDADRGPGFSDSSMLLQAAIDGQGVALGRRAIAGIDLEAGRLVIPFGPCLPSNLKYYLLAPEGAFEREKIKVFRDWMLAETAEARAQEGCAD